jgi:NAD-dependent SIR2 family protein deacetylase
MSDQRSKSIDIRKMRRVGTLVDLVSGMPRNDPRYALFLGAGASLSSGIPTSDKLITYWQRRVFLGEKKKTLSWLPHYTEEFEAWVQNEYPRWKHEWQATYGRQPSDYSLLFSHAFPDAGERQGFIEQLVSDCEPGPGYIYLASLVLAGHFHTFLTTNFDDLVHDTLFRYAGLKPIVCAFDSQVSNVRLQGPRPKVIKLHGDFLFTNLRNVENEVSRLDANMEEKFAHTCTNYGLIVIGYGGWDQSIMGALRVMLHRRECLAHGLHWCVYHEPQNNASATEASEALIPEDLYRMWELHRDKVHLYHVGSFDDVTEALYRGCRCEPPRDLAHPQERALYARLRDGIDNADQTWRLNEGFSALLAQFRKAVEQKPPGVVTLLDEADHEHRVAQDCLGKRLCSEARQHFEASIEKTTEALNMATPAPATPAQQIRALRRRSGSEGGLADVLLSEGNHATAKELDQAATERFSKLADDSLEDVRKGLAIDRLLGGSRDLRGHRLNLWFNGLSAQAKRLMADATISANEFNEALAWLAAMTSDAIYGSEYVKLLKGEPGGPALLELLLSQSRQERTRPSDDL